MAARSAEPAPLPRVEQEIIEAFLRGDARVNETSLPTACDYVLWNVASWVAGLTSGLTGDTLAMGFEGSSRERI
jgi:hypothetical protein